MTSTPDGQNIDFVDLLAEAQEQLSDITAIQQQQAALVESASVADGRVSVAVNAQGVVIETKIDEEYLEEYDLKDLGPHITEAAQAAAKGVRARANELMGPLISRRRALPSLSDIFADAPDIRNFEVAVPKVSLAPPNSRERLDLEADPDDIETEDDRGWNIRA